MEQFTNNFNVNRQLLVGTQGIAIEEFLATPVEKWIK